VVSAMTDQRHALRRRTERELRARHGADERPRPACEGEAPELFDTDSPLCDVELAKAICARCPLRPACYQEGVAGQEFGIWGGATQTERLGRTQGGPWRATGPGGVMTLVSPRPHQLAALAALQQTFGRHDRAQLVMACGTGKTLVGRWWAERAGAGLTLVVVPSLTLVGQTLAEWKRCHGWDFEPLVVCSDRTTAAGAAERAAADGADVDAPFWARHQAKVTTHPAVAARFLSTQREQRPRVVFSTYHSAPVLQDACAAAGVGFDLLVADEAHRLAGNPDQRFWSWSTSTRSQPGSGCS